MGLDEIRKAVLESAETQAARVIQAAKKHAAEQVEREKALAKAEAERQYEAKARTIEDEYGRKLIQFKGAAGKRLLEKRNACLRDIFQRARQEIRAWPQETYADVMQRLIERAAGDTGGALRVHPEERGLFGRVLNELNRGRGAQAQLAIDEAHPLGEAGGFVFVSAAFEVDQTLDTILADIKHELTPMIAADLFADSMKEEA